MSRETKNVQLAEPVQTLDSAKGEFEGYLAVFNNLDYNGDIIEPGAFKDTLQQAKARQARTGNPFLFPLLYMHDEDRPCGGFYDMHEDTTGLYVKGRCDLNIELGRTAFSGMQMGYMSQMSIGFDTLKAFRDAEGNRHLTQIRLWEGSAITTGYAANAEANVLATKKVGSDTVSNELKALWQFVDLLKGRRTTPADDTATTTSLAPDFPERKAVPHTAHPLASLTADQYYDFQVDQWLAHASRAARVAVATQQQREADERKAATVRLLRTKIANGVGDLADRRELARLTSGGN